LPLLKSASKSTARLRNKPVRMTEDASELLSTVTTSATLLKAAGRSASRRLRKSMLTVT